MIASKLRMNAASSIATHPVTVQPLRLAPSVEEGRAKTREPFENLTPSKDDLNVIALSVKTSTALANQMHFMIISDAALAPVDMQSERPFQVDNAECTSMPARQKLLPTCLEDSQIFRLAGLQKKDF